MWLFILLIALKRVSVNRRTNFHNISHLQNAVWTSFIMKFYEGVGNRKRAVICSLVHACMHVLSKLKCQNSFRNYFCTLSFRKKTVAFPLSLPFLAYFSIIVMLKNFFEFEFHMLWENWKRAKRSIFSDVLRVRWNQRKRLWEVSNFWHFSTPKIFVFIVFLLVIMAQRGKFSFRVGRENLLTIVSF